jgi:hypothetical protein
MDTAFASKKQQLLEELLIRHDEYLEMAGERAPLLMIDILATIVIKERDTVHYLQKRLDARDHGHNN